MRRRAVYVISIFVLMVTFVILLFGCGIHIEEYPFTPSDYEYALDDSIPRADMMSRIEGNESRGFRGEAYINLGMGEAYPGKGIEPFEALREECTHYEGDDVHLVQVYVYLGKYLHTDITREAFDELEAYFDLVDSLNMKMLLRFAYETGASTDGPRTQDIERHTRQIKAFFLDNIDLVNRTVYAVQLGMIGLWGEGHGAHHRVDVTRVARAVADMTPEGIPLMVRTPEMLSKVPRELEHRFGVHDDFLVGYDHEWGMMDWSDPAYSLLQRKCKYTITDAEMPWGSANERIDMMGVLEQCAGYGLTSLSVAHNYHEDDNIYALEQWKTKILTFEDIVSHRLPVNERLLVDGKISVYDYLKYHLGYQLVASNLTIENGTATFMLTNFGMALPYGYDLEVYVNGERTPLATAFRATDLTIFGQHRYSIPYTSGTIALRLTNTRDPSDTIRLFNNIPYIDGMNVIHEG